MLLFLFVNFYSPLDQIKIWCYDDLYEVQTAQSFRRYAQYPVEKSIYGLPPKSREVLLHGRRNA